VADVWTLRGGGSAESQWPPEAAVELGLEFLLRGASASNFQTRTLLGHRGMFLPAGALDEVHLERAKAVLRRMCLVATTDDLDAAAWSFDALLGYPHPASTDAGGRYAFGAENEADDAGDVGDADEATLLLLRDANLLDAQLLAYARTLSPRGP
jgi:hypothetical protein